MKDEVKNCEICGNAVPTWQIDREGQCPKCRADDRANDMTVGDLGGK